MQKLFGILAVGLTLFVGNTAAAAPLACCTGTVVCAGFDKCVDCPRGTRATNGTTASGYEFSHCAVQFQTGPTTTKSTQAWATEDDADAAVPSESVAADEGAASDDEGSQGPSTAACSAAGSFGAGSAAGLFALVPVLAGLLRRRRRN